MCNTDIHTDADVYPDDHPNGVADTNYDGKLNPVVLTISDGDADKYGDANPYPDADSHGDGNTADSYAEFDRARKNNDNNTDGDQHGDSDKYSYGFANRNAASQIAGRF
jgi:hypothetical protein